MSSANRSAGKYQPEVLESSVRTVVSHAARLENLERVVAKRASTEKADDVKVSETGVSVIVKHIR